MTPRERAIELTETIDNAGWGCLPLEAITIIKQAITAAIEEDRKSRECCKQEREACVKLSASIADKIWDYCQSVQWGTGRAMMEQREIEQIIIETIRARSESENKQ
jgi:hypothetical protein